MIALAVLCGLIGGYVAFAVGGTPAVAVGIAMLLALVAKLALDQIR